MLYLQLKERITLTPGQKLHLADLADVLGEKAEAAKKLPLDIHVTEGVWKVPASALVKTLLPVEDEITLIGGGEVVLHVSSRGKRRFHQARAVIAFLILLLGSALAITWFHEDVGMHDAQTAFYRMLSGKAPSSPWLIAIPYAVGVGLGVGMYYSVLSRRKEISPLEMKLNEYCQKAEQTAGRIP